MSALIVGIFLILVGSFGLDYARRRRSARAVAENAGGSSVAPSMLSPRFANRAIVVLSVLLVIAGLATAFV